MPDRYTFGYLSADTPAAEDGAMLGDLWMDTSATPALKKCTSLTPVTWASAEGAPIPHTLGGTNHTADTLANLNTKVSDATIENTTDSQGKVNTHAALTTGVHGVGAGTIAKVGDIATDANLSVAAQDAVSKRHSQNTDTDLDATFEATFEKGANKGAANGYAGLDAGGLVDASDLPDASATAEGISELATAAEVTAGTDAARTVCPDALAGSNYGKRIVEIVLIDPATALAIGDLKAQFIVPLELNGWNLVSAQAGLSVVSSAGTPTYQVRNITDAVDMLSTAITIDANEFTSYTAATPSVVNAAADDVATGDRIAIDKDVAGTGEKGDTIILVFQLP